MARYGDVAFTLAGKPYTVRYGNLAWDHVKRVLSVPHAPAALARVFGGDERARDVVVHAGLSAYHSDLTEAQARALYDEIPQPGERSMWNACWEAIGLALPDFKKRLEAAAAGPKEEPASAPPPKTQKRSGKRR